MRLDAILVNSGAKYRKEILAMPVVALEKTLNHMNVRKGIRGEETVGGYDNDAEIRPYRSSKDATDKGTFFGRTLTTYLGDIVEEFDPYRLFATVYGESFTSLTERKEADIVKDMALTLARKASSKLGKSLFKAVRNPSGNTTMDLFNGFNTIAADEISKGNITLAKGNLYVYSSITSANAGDVLKAIYSAASDELRDQENLRMYMPKGVLDKYEEWCLSTLGSVVYNQTYAQSRLHCDRNVELVPLIGLKNSEYIYISTKNNMLVGMDQMSDAEQAKIRECDNPKALQFFMCMYWGVQFEYILPEFLLVARTTAAPTPTPTPEGAITGATLLDQLPATSGDNTRAYATVTGAEVDAEVITEGADWLTVTSTGHKVKFSRTAYAYADEGDSPRIATVRVSAIDGSGHLDVTVKQQKASS